MKALRLQVFSEELPYIDSVTHTSLMGTRSKDHHCDTKSCPDEHTHLVNIEMPMKSIILLSTIFGGIEAIACSYGPILPKGSHGGFRREPLAFIKHTDKLQIHFKIMTLSQPEID